LAAAVWYIGGIMLSRSGLELVIQARELQEGILWPAPFIISGIVLGIIQAHFIFRHSCRKNLQCINQLEDPRLWQFFRPGFFLALGLMISNWILLDHYSEGKYFFMLSMAVVDLSLTISLLGSSHIFWIEAMPSDK
jgi:hypothetical protein